MTFVEHVDRWRLFDGEAKQRPVCRGLVIQEDVVTVEVNGDVKGALGAPHAAHVIHMRVRQQDRARGQALALDERDELVHLVARVDDYRVARPLAPNDVSVLQEWPNGGSFDDHLRDVMPSASRRAESSR
jgi:hypothetical protein